MSVEAYLILGLAGVAGVGIAYIAGHAKGSTAAHETDAAKACSQVATDTAVAAQAALTDSEVRDAVDATVRDLPAAAVAHELQQFTDPASSAGQGLQLDEAHSDQPAGSADGQHDAPDSGVRSDAAADLQPVSQPLKLEIPMQLAEIVAEAKVVIAEFEKAIPIIEALVPLVDDLAPSLDLSAKLAKIEAPIKAALSAGIVSDAEKVWSDVSAIIKSLEASKAAPAAASATPVAA